MMSIENPPILQLALTVSFAPTLDSLSMIDLADLYNVFSDELPIFGQIQRAGPMSYKQSETVISGGAMPRIVFSAEDTSMQIAFQNDRLTLLWQRTNPLSEPAQYPGFNSIVQSYFDAMTKLQKWIRDRGLPEIMPAVGEVSYTDAFCLDVPGSDKKRRIADFIKVFNPAVPFGMLNVDYNWTELMGGGLEGLIAVEITAPSILADGSVAVQFETIASFDPGPSWDVTRANFESAHQAALTVFHRVVNLESFAISE